VDIGGSLGAFFDADAGGNGLIELGEFDETLDYGGFSMGDLTRKQGSMLKLRWL
jgi:hypothetical protein